MAPVVKKEERCNTFSISDGVLTLAVVAAMTFSIGNTEQDLFIAPHAIVEICEETDSYLCSEEKGISESTTKVYVDTQEQENISMRDFSTELFEGITSFTDYENEAHERLMDRLSESTGLNILDFL